jgi:hypothetical protein
MYLKHVHQEELRKKTRKKTEGKYLEEAIRGIENGKEI